MQRIAAEEGLTVLQPELETKPRVYYRNMHLFEQCFVGGTVVMMHNGVEECAPDATVVLKKDGAEVGRATTDTFGEFKIDKLAPDSGRYALEVSRDSEVCQAEFDLGADSRYLGTLTLA